VHRRPATSARATAALRKIETGRIETGRIAAPALFTVTARAAAVGLSLEQITSRCAAAGPDAGRQRSA
jgi:hypothetical protein